MESSEVQRATGRTRRWLTLLLVSLLLSVGLAVGGGVNATQAHAAGNEGSTGNCVTVLKTVWQAGRVVAEVPGGGWVVLGGSAAVCSWVIGAAGGDALSSAICRASWQPGWWGDRARSTVNWVTHGQYQVC